MLTERYGLALSTASSVARDAYIKGSDRLLTLYPGAIEAFDRAIDADPGFAMAHAGKSQVLMREGNMPAARTSLAAASAVPTGLPAREASHIAFFGLLLTGQTEAAIAALRAHLATWPRDALVLSTAANPNGLIGSSGQIGQKHMIASLLDDLAPHYGDDFWFLAHHAMALSEDGQHKPARVKIERSMEINPNNAHGAHAFTHVCYEEGEPAAARGFLASWLAAYPPDGFFYGHLSWHRALGELEAGDPTEAFRLFREAFSLDRHSGGPQQKMSDATAFLWRWELAGYPRDAQAWRAMSDYAGDALPKPGSGLADLHVILAQAVAGDATGPTARARQIREMAEEGRYPSGAYLPALSRGFAAFERGDFTAAINAIEPLVSESERIGGSRAQHDLIGFTLLKAYLGANRPDDARRLLLARRPGASGAPVAGSAAMH